ncbi:MAG: hypothetical protein ABIM42_02340 [candidate division WOR-3 bacterium]
MNLLCTFIVLSCIYLSNSLDVKSLAITGNHITITYDNGITIYNLQSREIKASFPATNPELGILSPDLTRVYYIENKTSLSCYSIPAGTQIFSLPLDFQPDFLGIGLKTILLKSKDKSILLNYSGFDIPESERERLYISASYSLSANIFLPQIFSPSGKKAEISYAVLDSLNNIIYVGTKGRGVYFFSKNKLSYVDSLLIGIPLNDEGDSIVDALVLNDYLYLLTRYNLIRLSNKLITSYWPRPVGSQNFEVFDKSDSSIFIAETNGRIYRWEDGVWTTIAQMILKSKPLKLVFHSGVLYIISTREILGITEEGDTTFFFRNPFNGDIKDFAISGKNLVILIDGRIYFLSSDSLTELSEISTKYEQVISIKDIQGSLWAVTNSYLLNINPTMTDFFELNIKPPLKILEFDNKPMILYPELACVFSDSTFQYLNQENKVQGFKKIIKWGNRMVFISSKSIFICE